jgi:glycosyltransferase 2 family protein
VITLAVLVYLAWDIDLGDTIGALARLAPAAAAIVVGLLGIDRAIMIARWVILLRATGHQVATKSAAWIYLTSSFVGAFTPGAIGADVARAYTLTERTSQASDAVASVAVDRLLGLLAIVLVGVAGSAVWAPRLGIGAMRLAVVAGVVSIGATVAFLWADSWSRTMIPPRWHGRRLARRMLRLADATARYRGHREALALVLLLSIVVQLLRISQAYTLGRGIGIDVPFAYYLAFMPVGLIALLLPVSVSGFGLPQGIIVWLLQPQGVPEADALALSTLIVLSGIAANLPGAWLYLRARQSSSRTKKIEAAE